MKPEIEVFVFLDALGWDLVGTGDWLKDLLPHRRPVEMQFGYSCTAIPTILSGATPAEHGHLSLFRFDPKGSPFKGVARLMRCLRPQPALEARQASTRIHRLLPALPDVG